MVETISSVPAQSTPGAAASQRSFGQLGSQEFLQLLITQIRNQDPMEPVGNEQLLQQIASVREIELSSTLADSLRILTGEQRFGAASSLIGQFVTGVPDEGGAAQSGIVEGLRFDANGRPILQLSNGGELAVDQLATVRPAIRAAETLVGQKVVGLDRRSGSVPTVVEGLVTSAKVDASGEVLLELDTGNDLRLRDLIDVVAGSE